MVWKAGRPGIRAAVAMAAAALLATGCGSSGSGGSSKDSDATLVAYTGQSTDYQINFNPYSPSCIGGIGSIFEPLFYNNVLSSKAATPLLGTAYTWNADGTQLSITLRENVKWSDGEKFTAKDVVFTLGMISQHKEMNGVGYDGQASAVDDTHVVVKFDKTAFVHAPEILGKIVIVPEHKWKSLSNPATDQIATPVGTGPYVMSEFKAQAFTYTANPSYWGGEPAVKKVRFLALSGNQSGQQALKAGQVDWMSSPVPDIKDIEKNYPGYKAIISPLNQIALVTCGNSALGCTGPQTDPAVRRAIYYGLNRTQINSLAFENTSSEISPGFGLLKRDSAVISTKLQERTAPMQPDASKAKGLLESAGYTKGSDGYYAKDGKQLSLTVKTVTGWADYITAVNTMAQQLKDVGIKITVEQLSWNEWTAQRQTGQFQLIVDTVQQGSGPDPYYPYSYYFGSSGTAKVGEKATTNWTRYSDPQVDQALAALAKIDPKDTAARQPYLDTIQTTIEQAMPYIPVLTQGTVTEYHSSKFTGWPTDDNLYAFPAIWQAPDNAQVLKQLKPTGKNK